jgi:hypothetical protein
MGNEQETIEFPVRSAVLKQDTGGLVVRWVEHWRIPAVVYFCHFAACAWWRRKEGDVVADVFFGLVDGPGNRNMCIDQ